jgi:hypothetical protein
MSQITDIMTEYSEIIRGIEAENTRYHVALLQSLMLLQNNAVDDALQTIKKALGEE